MSHTQAVAISTTGDEHRMGFLETAIQHWDNMLGPGDSLFVTVDGDEQAAERARMVAFPWTQSVFQCGQPYSTDQRFYRRQQGVAVNKNTGLELMMDNASADHLYLCDDDTYPRDPYALLKHVDLYDRGIPHSMVCWGGHRLQHRRGHYATWLWPRGVMLYTHRSVVETVGGMVEAFGIGGHEHAEWSRRIHQHGLTPAPFCSPTHYSLESVVGPATRANVLWHCEDMKRPGETSVELGHRRKAITTVRKQYRDWDAIEELMEHMDGKTAYVPFRAHQNRRGSATLIPTSTGQGAGGDL